MSSTGSIGRLPNELIYKILIHTVAESIHSICILPLQCQSQWDMTVFKTLSAVSFSFQQIAIQVAVKAFGLAPWDGDPTNVMPLVDKQLITLRRLGMHIRDPLCYSIDPERTVYNQVSHLAQAYVLYLAVIGLRRHATKMVWSFKNAVISIQAGLTVAVNFCLMAHPPGIGAVLGRALEHEIIFLRSGIAIVEACESLAVGLDEASDTDKETLAKFIHGYLSKIEAAIDDCSTITHPQNFLEEMPSAVQFLITDMARTRLPNVLHTLTRCSVSVEHNDKYDIWWRARALMQGCRLLEMSWASHPWMAPDVAHRIFAVCY